LLCFALLCFALLCFALLCFVLLHFVLFIQDLNSLWGNFFKFYLALAPFCSLTNDLLMTCPDLKSPEFLGKSPV
jgi:hypothetical protein